MKPPGRSAAAAYDWLVLFGHLVVALCGAALLVVGLWQHVESVSIIGAIAILGGLVLPLLEGAFEIGPHGLKGSRSDLIRETLKEARRQGLPSEQTLELIEAAAEEPDVVQVKQRLEARRNRLVATLAAQNVGESVLLERLIGEIIRRVSAEKGWDFEPDAQAVVDDLRFSADFLISTRDDRLLVEAAILRAPEALVARTERVSQAATAFGATRAFIVVPTGGVHGHPRPRVEIVEVLNFEERLRQIDA